MIKINLKNIIGKFSEIGDRDKLKSVLTPHRDWKIIIIVSSFLLIVLSVWSVYFFIQVNEEKMFFEIEEKSVEDFEVLDVEGLKKTIEFFENKEEKFNTLTEEKPGIVDPSL